MIAPDLLAAYDRDGVACVRGLIDDGWIARMRTATDAQLAAPSPYLLDDNPGRAQGRFVRDRFLSLQNPEFRAFAAESPAADLAAAVMRSASVVLLTDLVFVKEPHTPEPTPWHHDKPYGWYEGEQLCQLWIALDTVDLASGSLEFVRSSHRWGALYNMRSFGSGADEHSAYAPVPDIDAHRDAYEIVHFTLEPGDALIFSELTLHAAPGNATGRRRRAISLHYAGDDATFAVRPQSRLPFADHGLRSGDPLVAPLFPRVR